MSCRSCPAPGYVYEYHYAPPPPPAIRYYRYDVVPDDYDEAVVVRPRVGACAPGYRWNGDACAYAHW